MSEALNKFVYGVDDDVTLRNQILEVTNLLKGNGSGCTPDQQMWLSYFQSPANISGMKEAYAKFGIPPKNRKSERPCFFCSWKDYCDWGDVFRFYYYSKIAQDYPALNPQVKSNCNLIKGYIQGLEQEKVNVDKEFTIRNDNERRLRQLEVLNDKLNDFNSLYATMNCDNWIADQERQKVAAERAAALAQSEQSNISVYKQTAQQSATGTTQIALYVLGGVAVIIGLMIIFRKKD
jgi:hypothetical protein